MRPISDIFTTLTWVGSRGLGNAALEEQTLNTGTALAAVAARTRICFGDVYNIVVVVFENNPSSFSDLHIFE